MGSSTFLAPKKQSSSVCSAKIDCVLHREGLWIGFVELLIPACVAVKRVCFCRLGIAQLCTYVCVSFISGSRIVNS